MKIERISWKIKLRKFSRKKDGKIEIEYRENIRKGIYRKQNKMVEIPEMSVITINANTLNFFFNVKLDTKNKMYMWKYLRMQKATNRWKIEKQLHILFQVIWNNCSTSPCKTIKLALTNFQKNQYTSHTLITLEISYKRLTRRPPYIWKWNIIPEKQTLFWITHGWKRAPKGN